jgi:hypothetical protein
MTPKLMWRNHGPNHAHKNASKKRDRRQIKGRLHWRFCARDLDQQATIAWRNSRPSADQRGRKRVGGKKLLRGRLHGAFSMCVFMSDKPFDAEARDIGRHASATNGLSDMKTLIENAPCNRPLKALLDNGNITFFL